jgi:hypothetical protein
MVSAPTPEVPAAPAPLLTLVQALVVVARAIDPEQVPALTDPGDHPFAMALAWDPLVVRAVPRVRALLTELIRLAQSHTWCLIGLPVDLQPGWRITDDLQLAGLEPDDFDVATSEIVLGGQRYRVRVETGPVSVSASGPSRPAPKGPRGRPRAAAWAAVTPAAFNRLEERGIPQTEAELGAFYDHLAELCRNLPRKVGQRFFERRTVIDNGKRIVTAFKKQKGLSC